MSGIYIHIPFCKQACSYCDFYFLTRQQLREPFVKSLIDEILSYKESIDASEPVETIYLGGGTPSLLNERQLSSIFSALDEVFNLQPVEVTMELNPDDVTADYLQMIRNLGIQRASMGIQSFHSDILTFMHRAHTREEALIALELLQKTDFPSFTVDLIYGNPGQTMRMLEEDIRQLLAFNPPHISAYSLTVEPNTRLGKQVDLGRISPPEDEEVTAHFDLVRELLEEAGILQYEVSNYAKQGREAVHNSNYWSHKNYLGFGPSAHSFRWDGDKAMRWKNRPDIKTYLEGNPEKYRDEEEHLDLHTLAEERIMLGLRTKTGVSMDILSHEYQYSFSKKQLEWIEGQIRKGTFNRDDHYLRMTPDGLKISDLLVVDLLSKG